MLPVVQIVLILETEKSSLERFDPRVRPASLSTPWYGAGDEGSLLFANFRSCSVERRHLGHKRQPLWRRYLHRRVVLNSRARVSARVERCPRVEILVGRLRGIPGRGVLR